MMPPSPVRLGFLAVVAMIVLLGATPGEGQQIAADAVGSYDREVYHYPTRGLRDPFRALPHMGEDRFRLEDLTLDGVVYHADPSRSIALLRRKGDSRPINLRSGEGSGAVRVLAISPDRVEIAVEEMGATRRGVLILATGTEEDPR